MGENIARSYLLKNHYSILDQNYYTHWGELDLFARKNKKVVFIEVKTRVGTKKGKPYEAINFYKIKALKRAIQYYLLQKKLTGCKLLLDVISIILDNHLQVTDLKHFQNIIC
jgi:putative endonuclease